MAKRRNFSAAFKAKVALEALRGDQTLALGGGGGGGVGHQESPAFR
jgi:hypothetical protein